MNTIENIIPINSYRSSIHQTRHLSTLKQNHNYMDDEYPSTMDVNVTFAKDAKKHLSPYEKLVYDSNNDARFKAEEHTGKRIGFYRILKDIGYGNFSLVKLGTHMLTKEKVAIKILDKTKLDDKTQRLLSREITSMKQLHHPNIIYLYEVIETPKHIHIVTEYASGGDLYTRITDNGKLSEDEAKYIFAQIVSAVDHMHSKGIIHRDIKSENVFFAKDRLIKLGDFGFSTYSEKNETLTTFCGSPPYAAPELYRDESYVGIYVDIWAMGVTLYFMITGLMPFRAENVGKLRKSIIDGNYSIPGSVSNQCQDLLRGLLNSEINERWSIERMRSCSWLAKQTFNNEVEPFPTNLNNYAASAMKTKTRRTSLEYQAYAKLEELGMTSELSQRMNNNSNNIRDPVNGTFRIILHRLQKQENAIERDDSYDKQMREDLPTTYGRSLSLNHEAGRGKHKRVNSGRVPDTTVCTIL